MAKFEKKTKEKVKKPFYKKWWFWLIIAFVVIGALGSGGDSGTASKPSEPATVETQASTTEATTEATEATEPLTEKEAIEKILRDRITAEYISTDIDHITINDNLGTEKDGDYIALVYLVWNVKNSGKTSKEMLTMYSNDLAAYLGQNNSSVEEIAIFWDVPYLNDNAKCQFVRTGNGFIKGDFAWGNKFN